MKRLLIGLACALLVACSGGPTAPSTPTAVQFRLDANSCGSTFGTRTVTFSFFIDGTSVGTATLGVGQTSQLFFVGAGSHVAGASVTNTSFGFGNTTITVPAGQTFTVIMPC